MDITGRRSYQVIIRDEIRGGFDSALPVITNRENNIFELYPSDGFTIMYILVTEEEAALLRLTTGCKIRESFTKGTP
jgi:hypothetical protein